MAQFTHLLRVFPAPDADTTIFCPCIIGEQSVTVDAGDGYIDITFSDTLNDTPVILCGKMEDADGNVFPSSITTSGFRLNWSGLATSDANAWWTGIVPPGSP